MLSHYMESESLVVFALCVNHITSYNCFVDYD